MPSADDISRTIEPGSLDYGDRQVVNANLQQALGGGGGTVSPAPQAMPPEPEEDELEFLDQGPVSELPVTAGLSAGPGGPPAGTPLVETSKVERLRLLATEATSPVMRHLARQALRAELARAR
jgi:hypothetical protein